MQCLKQSLHSQDAWQFSSGKPNLQAPANAAQMLKGRCCEYHHYVALFICCILLISTNLILYGCQLLVSLRNNFPALKLYCSDAEMMLHRMRFRIHYAMTDSTASYAKTSYINLLLMHRIPSLQNRQAFCMSCLRTKAPSCCIPAEANWSFAGT